MNPIDWTPRRLIAVRAVLTFAVAFLVAGQVHAAQTRTFTITRPAGYFDGTPFGTEELVYVVYNAADDKQLFSTHTLVTKRTDIPDGATCFYVRAGVYNVTANSVVPDTLGDLSPRSCAAPAVKKVGLAGLVVQ